MSLLASHCPPEPRGLFSMGALLGQLVLMSWHFGISNWGVLGAQEAERVHGGFGLSGCPPSHHPFSSPFP